MLFDVGCTNWKCSETDGQPRELRIRLDPDLARWVEEHEKQQAAVIAALPPLPPPRPVGTPRKLPVVEAGTERTPLSQAMEAGVKGGGGGEGLSL